MNENVYITVNGVPMTKKEFLKYKKQKEESKMTKKQLKAKKKKKKKEYNDITVLEKQVPAIMKSLKVMKSLTAYYDNGYRQWGTVHRTIMGLDEIGTPFVRYNASVKQMEKTLSSINEISHANEKAVFAYVRKLSYILDDIKNDILELIRGVGDSGVLEQFKDREVINGEGRRLGLKAIASKSLKAISDFESVINDLQGIADEGLDIMSIGGHFSTRAAKITRQ